MVDRLPAKPDAQMDKAAHAVTPVPMTSDDLFDLKFLRDARFRPGGGIAYVVSSADEANERETYTLMLRLDGQDARELYSADLIELPRWSPDGRLIAFNARCGGIVRLHLMIVDSLSARALSPPELSVQGPCSWSPNGESIAFTGMIAKRTLGSRRVTSRDFRVEGRGLVDQEDVGLYRAVLGTGHVERLATGMMTAMLPAYSPCGLKLLFMGSDEVVGYSVSFLKGAKLCILDLGDGRVTPVLEGDWTISAAQWTRDGERIVFAGASQSPLPVPMISLWTMACDGSEPQLRIDTETGNVGLRIQHDMPTWNTQNNIFAVGTDYVYATVTRGGSAHIVRVSLNESRACETIADGDRSCLIMDIEPASGEILYAVSDLHAPWKLFRARADGSGECVLTDPNRGVMTGWPPIVVERLAFKSDNGLDLQGWVVRDASASGPQPTIMFIHGGPYHSTGNAFRFDFRLLCSNGYSILLANFRGSVGYGERFAQAMRGDWGRNAFPDHMAAVDAAVERKLADPARLGVWGHSHGGFATMWIVGHSRRFKAAVAEAGLSNFVTAYYLSDAPHLFAAEMGGRPDQVGHVYRDRSPLSYAQDCRTPTLLIHGEADLRCPIAESEQFYRALLDVGCRTEFVRLADADHMGDSTGPLEARRAQNLALVDWFGRYL